MAGGAALFYLDQQKGGKITNTLINIFPTGGDSPTPPPDDGGDINGGDGDIVIDIVNGNGLIKKYRQITISPVTGFTIIQKTNKDVVRYMEKGRGHIFDYTLNNGEEVRASNKTMPKIQEVLWNDTGETFIIRYPDEGGVVRNFSRSFEIKKGSEEIYVFSEEFRLGSRGEGVLNLQKILNTNEETRIAQSGPGSLGAETEYFGKLTESAVKKFQDLYAEDILEPQDLSSASGVVDGLTQEKLNEISQTLFGPIEDEEEDVETETKLSSTPLPNIKGVVVSPQGTKIFYTMGFEVQTLGIVSDFVNQNQSQIFNSFFGDWQIQWPQKDVVALTTKPSEEVAGILYFLNTETEILKKIIDDVKGLTTLVDPAASKVLYSKKSSSGNGFYTYIYDMETRQSIVLNIQTLPEKCVWGKNNEHLIYCGIPVEIPLGEYPDSWYQGEIGFSDRIWEINILSGEQRLLFDPRSEILTEEIDVIHPMLDNDEKALIFINKKDSTLWRVDLL